jgi:hypothetical protein
MRRLVISIFYVSDISRFFFLSTICTGRTGPEGGTYFLLSKLIVLFAPCAVPRPDGKAFERVEPQLPYRHRLPAYPRTRSSGYPADFSFLVLLASLLWV